VILTKISEIIAYHFTSNTLRDGRSIPPIGETLVHDGPLVMYRSGLHASIHPLDALRYATGSLLHRVRLSGKIVTCDDKLVASERTIVASIDATDLLQAFARWCALQVIKCWAAPPIVREYLETGREELREAAGAEAWEAQAAASAAAWAAKEEVAWMAAWAEASAASAAASAAWEAEEAAGAAAWEAMVARMEAWKVEEQAQREKFAEMVRIAFEEVESD